MYQRFFRIKKYLQEIQEVEELLLDSNTRQIFSDTFKYFERVHSVTMYLQKEGFMPDKVQFYFHDTCSD